MRRFLFIVQGLVMLVAAFVAVCPPTIVMKGIADVRTVLLPFWQSKPSAGLIVQRDVSAAVTIGFALLVIELGLWWFMFMLRLPNQKSATTEAADLPPA